MNMNNISCPGENGVAGTPSSGTASFSSGCAVDVDGSRCGVASTSSWSLLIRLCCPLVDFDDVEAIEAMLSIMRTPVTKGKVMWSGDGIHQDTAAGCKSGGQVHNMCCQTYVACRRHSMHCAHHQSARLKLWWAVGGGSHTIQSILTMQIILPKGFSTISNCIFLTGYDECV